MGRVGTFGIKDAAQLKWIGQTNWINQWAQPFEVEEHGVRQPQVARGASLFPRATWGFEEWLARSGRGATNLIVAVGFNPRLVLNGKASRRDA